MWWRSYSWVGCVFWKCQKDAICKSAFLHVGLKPDTTRYRCIMNIIESALETVWTRVYSNPPQHPAFYLDFQKGNAGCYPTPHVALYYSVHFYICPNFLLLQEHIPRIHVFSISCLNVYMQCDRWFVSKKKKKTSFCCTSEFCANHEKIAQIIATFEN